METIKTLLEYYQEGSAIILTVYLFARVAFPSWIEVKFKNPFE